MAAEGCWEMVDFPEVLLINLKSREDRLLRTKKELESSAILNRYKEIEGIDGTKLSEKDILSCIKPIAYEELRSNKKANGLYLTRGGVGLALTYKSILENSTKNTLILEDDIRLSANFDYFFAKFISYIPDEWDVLYLGWHPSKHLVLSNITYDINKISGQINGTHAWIFNYKAKNKLLSMFPLRYQVDTELYRLPNINRFAPKFPLITTIASKSDIQN